MWLFGSVVLEYHYEICEYVFTKFMGTVVQIFKVSLCSSTQAFCNRVSSLCTIQRQVVMWLTF